ncbi:enoyl-CoA hydratase [Peniophora sp. CONT]|nr:enoyl-CoA hydratase [Peniophora sp. CONT]
MAIDPTPRTLVYTHPAPDLPGVHCLALNRPSARNALSVVMVRELADALNSIASNPGIHALIVYSPHSAFCAGADLRERASMSPDEVRDFLDMLNETIAALEALDIPTIAAIDGPALGGGLEMAFACDFRVVARGVTKMGLPECTLGIIPGAGGTQRAPRLLGRTRAKELIFTGRMVDAREAKEIGLVDYVANEEQTAYECALELAGRMSRSAPLALRAAKRAIGLSESLSLAEGLRAERACYEPLLSTRDRREALSAFGEKRPARFLGM